MLSDDGASVHQGRQVRCGHLITVRWSARGQLTATREPQESPVLYPDPQPNQNHLVATSRFAQPPVWKWNHP